MNGKQMKYCSRCVYPAVAVNLVINGDVCSACQSAEENESSEVNWENRAQEFRELAEKIKSETTGNYDCVIPVSGGKDSYFQTHIALEHGLKPLLVTYHGNNYLPEGNYNRDRMREVFDVDHVVFGPSVSILKKMNRLGFRKTGDMNWHNHCGIFTYPMQAAVKFGVPIVLWGEVPWDISGMHSVYDRVEFSNRTRREHGLRGYDWHDFVGDELDYLSEKDLLWAKYPSDDEILNTGLRGLYIGNYFQWEANLQTQKMIDLYGWKPADQDFERTYRKISNLDDRYENGVHDLLKFIKFGYGRASDHAAKDIRAGLMSRSQGVEMVRKYDSVVSSDLEHWLEYVNVSKEEFWRIADSFRDPRVWSIENGRWTKDTPWGEVEDFGSVHIPESEWDKYISR
jgi:N-acetyl sugar amidotransferase